MQVICNYEKDVSLHKAVCSMDKQANEVQGGEATSKSWMEGWMASCEKVVNPKLNKAPARRKQLNPDCDER